MKRIESILERIRKHFGVFTDKELCEKWGIPYGTLDTWKNRDNIPTKRLDLLSKNEGISLEYILTGKEPEVNEHKNIIKNGNCDIVKINFYHDTTAAAGYGCINGDELPEPLEISRSFLANILGLKVFKNLDIIGVQGDSMEPFISNGEYVIVERTDEARNNEIVIANVNGEVYVKRLLRDPFQKWVKLISANKSYEDIMLKDDELQYINIIGVVRAKFRPF